MNTRTTNLSTLVLLSCLALVVAFAGCAKSSDDSADTSNAVVVVGKPAPVPEGVVRYCWEEPMVKQQQVGPGLDAEGRWYNPAHVAVREVRQGKWRPCKP